MTELEQQALLNLAIHAAFADGAASTDERAAVEKLCQEYRQAGVPVPSMDPAARAKTVADLCAQLRTTPHAKLAYEMAMSVCDTDGNQSPDEKEFLNRIRADLGLPESVAAGVQSQVAILTAPTTPAAAPASSSAPAAAKPAELDSIILDRAILAGALERSPESFAAMGLGQLQRRLVEQTAQAHGAAASAAQVTELLSTLGLAQPAQVVEGFLGRALGGILGKGKSPKTGGAFAATYALGRVASQYFSQQSRLTNAELRERFDLLRQKGEALLAENEAAIAQKGAEISLANLPKLIRGSA